MKRCVLLAVAVATALVGAGVCSAAPGVTDWNQWRGPNRDGTTPDADWNPEALRQLKIAWQASVGAGQSAPVVAKGRLYIHGSGGGEQAVRCLWADSGKEIWKYAIPRKGGPSGLVASTGLVDGDRLYVTSAEGVLTCLEAATGKMVWKSDLETLGASKPMSFDWTVSPAVVGDLLVLSAGAHGMALDKRTGRLVWGEAGTLMSSTALVKIGGASYVVCMEPGSMHMVDLVSGDVLWSQVFSPDRLQAVLLDPVVVDSKLFVSTFRNGTLHLLSMTGANEAWQTTEGSSWAGSWVRVGGHLYGQRLYVDSSFRPEKYQLGQKAQVRCLDLVDGRVVWSEDAMDGTLIAAGGRLILLSDDGALRVAAADPKGYREHSAAQLPGKAYYTPPVLVGDRLYVRNFSGTLLCIDMR